MIQTSRSPLVSLDDSVLDRLAAQVRAHPPLPDAEVAELLARARREPGGDAAATLTSHLLGAALDASLSLRDAGDDVDELFQEGGLAVAAAVAEYVGGDGGPAGLRAQVRTAVEAHIADVQSGERRRREEAEAFVRDSRLLDMAEVALRQRLGRPATTAELAAALKWTERRVELVGEILDAARRIHDESLIPFLDDDDPA